MRIIHRRIALPDFRTGMAGSRIEDSRPSLFYDFGIFSLQRRPDAGNPALSKSLLENHSAHNYCQPDLLHSQHLTYTVFYKPLTTPASWIQFLVFGSNMNFAFWYLNAYIETLLIFILCLYTRTDRLLLIGIPFFLLCNLLIGKYGFVIGHHVWFHRNFITVGIPFIGLGWLLRKYQHDILKIISGKCSLFLFAISTLLVYAEALILKMAKVVNGGDTYFFTIPMVICMFIFCLHHPSAGSESLLETTGKKYSLDIYIYHVLVYVLLVKITTYLHFDMGGASALIVFFTTLLFAMIFRTAYDRTTIYIRSNPLKSGAEKEKS